MPKDHLELIWDGKTYRGKGSIHGKRIRTSLNVRSESKKILAQRVLDALFEDEYLKGLERKKAKETILFTTASINYMKEFGFNRYAAYLEKNLSILGPSVHIGELNKAELRRLGAEHLPTYTPQSVMDCFVKPTMTIIRHANGERRDPIKTKSKPVRVLTVSEVLRLLDTAANNPRILRWTRTVARCKRLFFNLAAVRRQEKHLLLRPPTSMQSTSGCSSQVGTQVVRKIRDGSVTSTYQISIGTSLETSQTMAMRS